MGPAAGSSVGHVSRIISIRLPGQLSAGCPSSPSPAAAPLTAVCARAPELLGIKRKVCAYAAPTPASAPTAAAAAMRCPKLSPERKRHCNSAQASGRPELANPRDRAGLLCAESLPDADAAQPCSPSSSECAASCSFYTGSGGLPKPRPPTHTWLVLRSSGNI